MNRVESPAENPDPFHLSSVEAAPGAQTLLAGKGPGSQRDEP